jgi:hypothetical protein
MALAGIPIISAVELSDPVDQSRMRDAKVAPFWTVLIDYGDEQGVQPAIRKTRG